MKRDNPALFDFYRQRDEEFKYMKEHTDGKCNKCNVELTDDNFVALIDNDSAGGYQCSGSVKRCNDCVSKYGLWDKNE